MDYKQRSHALLDIKITNARIITGDGSPSFDGSVAVEAGHIVGLGGGIGGSARTELDAEGRVACPGFVDLHNHASHGTALNFLQQGATLLVGGNCGMQPGPVGETAEKCRAEPIGHNLAMLAGHNTIRTKVMGRANRPAAPKEIEAMKALVGEAMRDGAMGFSTGLPYVPGAYAATEEVIELARAAAEYGGFYVSHVRNEGERILEAMEEALRIGRESGLPVHLSHHKLMGVRSHGRSGETLAVVDKARAEGMDVTLDQYPYAASCGTIQLLMPPWAGEGTEEDIQARLKDPQTRAVIGEEVARNLETGMRGFASGIVVATCPKERSIEGLSLEAIAVGRGLSATAEDAAETVLDIVSRDPRHGGCMCVYHGMSEDDVERIMRYPLTSIGSDGWAVEKGAGRPHPRLYGTFPRVLGRYCRDQGLFSLEEAIRKMTSLPAARLSLNDRGILKEGAWADLVVFDPETIIDRSTFENPHHYPAGIDYVIVNGELVMDHGRDTGATPGVFVPRDAPASS